MAENAPVRPFLSPVGGKPVDVAFDGGRLTSDAGVLVLAEIERKLGIAERLARGIEDPRDPQRVTHQLAEMIRFRALLVAAGYPDGNDCDVLRTGPAFKLAVGRPPETGAELCSPADHQPAGEPAERDGAQADDGGPVSSADIPPGDRPPGDRPPGDPAEGRMVELFCASFTQVPRRIVLDIEPGSPRTLFVGWGRQRGSRSRPAAALPVPRPLRQPLLPADPYR